MRNNKKRKNKRKRSGKTDTTNTLKMENKQVDPESNSGKKSNAKVLEDLHKKALERDDDGFEDFKQRLSD